MAIMWRITGLLTLLAVTNIANAECEADDCLLAVQATGRLGAADCVSFIVTTVTPTTSTITVTATGTSTVTVWPGQGNSEVRRREQQLSVEVDPDHLFRRAVTAERRQITTVLPDIPTYASVCGGTEKHSSACSCIGVTAVTTTAAPLVTTTTTTVRPTITGFHLATIGNGVA